LPNSATLNDFTINSLTIVPMERLTDEQKE
jgi:hypothetical protein